jgi:hypothetical protein
VLAWAVVLTAGFADAFVFFPFFFPGTAGAGRVASTAIVGREAAYWTGVMAPRWIGRASASREEKITRFTL